MGAAVPFRFNAERHEYRELGTGHVFPSVTQMLERGGWVDSTWYTEESRDRGTAVHKLSAAYDLGALDVAGCVSPFRGYLLAHVAAMAILRPEVLAVEEAAVHPVLRFAGTPDRVVRLQRLGVLEIKTTQGQEPSHAIQTALQSILVSEQYALPAELFERSCLYLTPAGKWKLRPHEDRQDFAEARKLIRRFCR